MTRFSRAKDKLLDHLDDVVMDLFPRRLQRAAAWFCVSPGNPSKNPDQLRIHRTGAAKGGWKDFITDQTGDAIDLVAYVQFGAVTAATRMNAVAWIEDRFGIRDMDPGLKKAADRAAEERRQAAAAEDIETRAKNHERARKMFYRAEENIVGTLADTYLQTRGIHLDEIAHLCRSTFRFDPAYQYWLGQDRQGRKPVYPALVSKLVDHEGHGRACHLTYLAKDGRGKAPVDKAKLMWPEIVGFCVRVTDGESGLSAEMAAEQGRRGLAALTEGIEDALSVALAAPSLRCWAAGSLSNLLHVPDHAAVSGWLIYQDNDWDKPQAVDLFNRSVERLKSFGKPVEVLAMPADWGKDVNDAINS